MSAPSRRPPPPISSVLLCGLQSVASSPLPARVIWPSLGFTFSGPSVEMEVAVSQFLQWFVTQKTLRPGHKVVRTSGVLPVLSWKSVLLMELGGSGREHPQVYEVPGSIGYLFFL